MDTGDSSSAIDTDDSVSIMETGGCFSAVISEKQEASMRECCLWLDLGTCNSKICSGKKIGLNCFLLRCCIDYRDWPKFSVPVASLTGSAMDYLRKHGVITRFSKSIVTILERDLVLNRLQRIVIIENPDIKVCPCHRYSYGIGWRVKDVCQHEDHRNQFGDGKFTERPAQSNVPASRVACFNHVQRLAGFPYGGKICDSHRMNLSKADTYSIGQDTVSASKATSAVQSFALWNHEPRDLADSIISSLHQSPITSKTTTLLEDQTPGAVRRLTAKLQRAVAAATSTIANSIAPGQGESLVNLAGLEAVLTDQNSSLKKNTAYMDEPFLGYLVEMYRAYDSKNLPYNEKIRLLALIPDHWGLSYEDIEERFQCTKHAIKTARALRMATDTPLHIETRE